LLRKNNQYTLNNYLYEYPIPDEIGRSHVIDATSGSLMRFVNHHSAQPNLKPLYAFSGSLYHLILVTQRRVAKGEQLTYDYGQNYWYVRSPPLE
jgi:SET domain-containing protein